MSIQSSSEDLPARAHRDSCASRSGSARTTRPRREGRPCPDTRRRCDHGRTPRQLGQRQIVRVERQEMDVAERARVHFGQAVLVSVGIRGHGDAIQVDPMGFIGKPSPSRQPSRATADPWCSAAQWCVLLVKRLFSSVGCCVGVLRYEYSGSSRLKQIQTEILFQRARMSPVPRPPKSYRASRNRVRRIKFRGNWSTEVWILIAIVLIALFILVPRLIGHPPKESPVRIADPR